MEPERYTSIGAALGLDLSKMTAAEKKTAILGRVEQFKKSAGITKTLGQRGVKLGDIPELAEKALKDACMVTNPRDPSLRDIEVVYEEALYRKKSHITR